MAMRFSAPLGAALVAAALFFAAPLAAEPGSWLGAPDKLPRPQRGDPSKNLEFLFGALKIAPDAPSVLSNLGLSYVLAKDLPKAEEIMRRANSRPDADQRVRLNLALAVGLQGRVAEAESIVKADRPAEEAAANVAELKRLLSRKGNARADAGKLPVAAAGRPD